MEIIKTPLEGVVMFKPKIFGDKRGYFVETWQEERYKEAGIHFPFVQDNLSKSTRGILRGLHFQKQHPQGKLVMVSMGEVFDVAVDIRKDSPTFGKWFGFILSEKNLNQLWIPPGFAHGFVVLSEEAHFQYKCTDYYHPEDEGSIRWNDPEIGIEWPIDFEPVISAKDARAPTFSSVKKLLLGCQE